MTEPLNIFIDTCILHGDYFFHNKSNRQLFDYMKEGLVYIFMSDIVLKELRRHYELELKQADYEIEKIIKDAKRLQFKAEIESLDEEAMLKRFDDNYASLAATDYFEILYYSNDMLPRIVENAINKNIPFFTDRKSEIKDNLIWMTYSAFVENKKLNNCFLLSNNVTDFCDKDNHSIAHKELRSDTERFAIYKSTADFLAANAGLIEKPKIEFRKYIEGLEIDEEYVKLQLGDYFMDIIEEEIAIRIVTETDYNLYLQHSDDLANGIRTHYFDIASCEEIKVEVLNQRALISGIFYCIADFDLSKYNFNPECPEQLTITVEFNYDLLEDEQCDNLEITNIEYD
jgi:hypothetical protein